MVTGTGNEVVQAYINQVDEAEVERLEAADDRARLAAEANVAVSQSPVRSAAERLVQLDGVELLGPDGVPTLLPHAGDPLTIRLRYTCASPAERPLFSFAIMNEQGVLVANLSFSHTDATEKLYDGTGTVDYTIDRLSLLPGEYHITIAVHDSHATKVFDKQEQAVRFRVHADHDLNGLVDLMGTWDDIRSDDEAGA